MPLWPTAKVLSGARPVSGASRAYLKALRAAELASWEEPGIRTTRGTALPTLREITADFEAGIVWETWLAWLLALSACAALFQFAFGVLDFFGKWSEFVTASF